jgi:glycosyltransferase involved in cell wall biosynthesis
MLTISVIIPTHNRATLVRNAIESVARQTYHPHELLIVDDGSTDDTNAVVNDCIRHEKGSELSIRYIYQEQAGAPVARNTGVAAATGDWVAFLDSDDRWLPQKLEWQAQALEKYAAVSAACVTDASYVNNPHLRMSAFQKAGTQCDELIGTLPDIAKRIAYGYHGMYLQTLIVHRQLVLEIGGFDPLLTLGEDSDLLFCIANRTSICYVNLPLVEIDRTPDRSNGTIELARKEEFYLKTCQYLYEKWLTRPPNLDPEIRKRVARRLQEIHTGWSSWHLINGNGDDALRSLSIAMKYNFTGKAAFKWLLTRTAPGLARSVVLGRRARTPPATLF